MADDPKPEIIAEVARALFGAPNAEQSNDNRLVFEAIELDMRTGVLFDREAEDVVSIFDLVRRHLNLDEERARLYLGRFFQENVFPEADSLPDELQLERDLLGLILCKPSLLALAEEEVSATDFLMMLHGRLFAVFLEARESNFDPGLEPIIKALGGDARKEIFPGFTTARYVAHLAASAPRPFAQDADHVARELARRVRHISELERGDVQPEPPPRKSMYAAVKWRDQNETREEYEYVIEDLIPAKQAVLIKGETQSGKSFYTMHMGISGARGVHFFDRRIIKPFGVIYCAYEAGQGYPNRMRAYTKFHGLPVTDLPFTVLTKPVDLWSDKINTDKLISEIQWLAEDFGGIELGAVVIDTHNAATPGASEIDSKEVSQIRDRYMKIKEKCNCGIWIVGHNNAAGKHRGSELLGNNIETVIDISRKVEFLDKVPVPIKDHNGVPIRVARVNKQREGVDGLSWEFVVHNVEIGVNAFGRARTSCVVLSPAKDPQASDNAAHGQPGRRDAPRPLNARERVILQALKDAVADHGEDPHGPAMPKELRQLPKSIGRVVKVDHWRTKYIDKASEAEPNTVNQHLKRASDLFLTRRIMGRINPYAWVIPKRNGQPDYGELLPPPDPVGGPESDRNDSPPEALFPELDQ